MKHKNPNVRYVNKWQGYYLEDCICKFYLFYDKKDGCVLKICCCDTEKHTAEIGGRTKRNRKWSRWDT